MQSEESKTSEKVKSAPEKPDIYICPKCKRTYTGPTLSEKSNCGDCLMVFAQMIQLQKLGDHNRPSVKWGNQ
jgi:protein-arginine kinase activator protein McsA